MLIPFNAEPSLLSKTVARDDAESSTDLAPGAVRAPGPVANPWRWRRASLAEYVAIPIIAAGTAFFENENRRPSAAHWTATNDFDEAFRNLLRLKRSAARDAARVAGDTMMWAMIAAPVVDSFSALGMRDRNWDALWQTSMINLESFTFTSLASSLMQNLIARQKPLARNCTDLNACEETQPNRSMPSGHTAFAFTGAGLVCTHRAYQSFYGSPEADRAACWTGLGVASALGVVRMMADGHYATDVMVGAAVGMFSGFGLPRLLHYSWPAKNSETTGEAKGQAMVLPQLLQGGGGLKYQLSF